MWNFEYEVLTVRDWGPEFMTILEWKYVDYACVLIETLLSLSFAA